MIQQHNNELKLVYSTYGRIHEEIAELNRIAQDLVNRQAALSQELEYTRKAEKLVINKIEAELDRPLTQEDLLEIIQTNE